MIYLDHNATTPVHPEALKAMEPFFHDRFGNSSSAHAFGKEPKEKVQGPGGHHQTGHTPHQAQDHGLGEELPDQSAPAGPQGETHGDLLAAPDPLGQEEAGQVGAGFPFRGARP